MQYLSVKNRAEGGMKDVISFCHPVRDASAEESSQKDLQMCSDTCYPSIYTYFYILEHGSRKSNCHSHLSSQGKWYPEDYLVLQKTYMP